MLKKVADSLLPGGTASSTHLKDVPSTREKIVDSRFSRIFLCTSRESSFDVPAEKNHDVKSR